MDHNEHDDESFESHTPWQEEPTLEAPVAPTEPVRTTTGQPWYPTTAPGVPAQLVTTDPVQPEPEQPGYAGAAGAGAYLGGGWTPPMTPPAGAAPGGSGGAGWVGPPGAYWMPPTSPTPPTPPTSKHRGRLVTAVALLVVTAMAAGFGVGHLAWPGTSTAQTPTTGTTTPSSGSSGFPFGSGTSGSQGFPFGSNSSGSNPSGSNSSASGGPADASAIASGVDPGLVDVNTTLGYQQAEAAGTGIVLTSNGLVLTNNHVIDGATSISVTDVGNGHVYKATVVGYDRSADVALLQLSGASGLQVASLGNSNNVHVGEAVVGIGNAGGVGGTPSVAGGSVTAVNKSITATEADGGNAENLTGLIEVNADIQAGDSGGPLVDTAGKVLGMDTAASTGFSFQTTGTQGYAIPINTALEVARKIEASNGSDTVHIGATGFLGVEVSDEPSNTAQTGALVVGVVQGSPAAAAGLVDGDSITALDGNTVGSAEALTTMMGTHHPGNHVQLTWTDASGAVQRATLKLSAGPAA